MASYTPNLNLLKKSPVTDGNDTFNVDTMLNENWDKIDTALGNPTPAAQKLGLTGDLSAGASLGVLATVGDLHVWRRTVGSVVDYPVSVNPNAYQEGSNAGITIKYLGALGEKCTAKTGTYIGTGSYGESAANYIPFDRLPSLFIVAGIPENIYNSQMIIPTFLLSDTVDDTLCGMSVYSRSTTPSWRRIKSVYKNGRLYWYSEDDRYGQMNYANTKYTWIALFL